jgi:hypothetical protein
MTDFDRTSLDRILPAPTGPADWEDVLKRSRAHETRRRWGALAAAALVLAIGTASALGVRAVLDADRPTLPPTGARPSKPPSGTLVLGYVGRPSNGLLAPHRGKLGRVTNVWIYADGRVIWRREGGPYTVAGVRTGFLEQRLTMRAVERLRSQVLATGLFEYDSELTSPKLQWGWLYARAGGSLVSVRWCCGAGTLPPGAPPPPRTVATRAQTLAIGRLSKLFAQPMSALPASAWKDPTLRAYVPARYGVCYSGGSGTYPRPLRPSGILGSLPPAARDLVRGKSRAHGGKVACSELTTDEARRLEDILTVAGFARRPRGFVWAVPQTASAEPPAGLREISFQPVLPHGQAVGPMGG